MSGATGRVAVVGGGLAGTSAALRLADRGWEVTLLETRQRLGGAAYSFQRGAMSVDTGQHVLLRCYREYSDLLARMGVGDRVHQQPRLDITVLRPDGRPGRLRRSARGPAAWQVLGALARYRLLTPAERMGVVRAAARLRTVDPADPAADAETLGHWLRRHGQRARAVDRLWALLCVAALNLSPADASLALMARVMRTGLLGEVAAGDLAYPAVPLSALHDGPARRLLQRRGVRCRTGERVTHIDAGSAGLVVRTDSAEIEAAGVVVAVPHRHASRLVPPGACPDRERWKGLGSSPIVNVHLHYDRAVTNHHLAAAVDSPVQWLFDRTHAAGVDGQYLVVSLSAADEQIGQPARELLATQRQALERLFPAARDARVLDAFVTREPHATFRQRAGSAPLRPPATTRWPGLVLAGAWTGTGWPDTMEGAVRSGNRAADLLGSPATTRQLTEPRP